MRIILDACNNHVGSLEIISEMIYRASELGIDYIKFQLYDPKKLNKDYPNYDSYKAMLDRCVIKPKVLQRIFRDCKKYDISPAFTIFTSDRLAILDKYAKTAYSLKIASPDLTNTDLVRDVIRFGTGNIMVKHIFISTGMDNSLVVDSVTEKYKNISRKIKFLYCVSKYPCTTQDINFSRMQKFDGFSDHTPNIKAAKKAAELGMDWYEAHFTLGKDLPGKDHKIARTPGEVEELVNYINYLKSIPIYKERWVK